MLSVLWAGPVSEGSSLYFMSFTFSPAWLFLLRCDLRRFFLQSFSSQFSPWLHFWSTNLSSLLPFLADELQISRQDLFLSVKPTIQMSTIQMSTNSLIFPIVTLLLKFPSQTHVFLFKPASFPMFSVYVYPPTCIIGYCSPTTKHSLGWPIAGNLWIYI